MGLGLGLVLGVRYNWFGQDKPADQPWSLLRALARVKLRLLLRLVAWFYLIGVMIMI